MRLARYALIITLTDLGCDASSSGGREKGWPADPEQSVTVNRCKVVGEQLGDLARACR